MKTYKHIVLIMGFLMVFNLTGFFPLSFSAENETSRASNKNFDSVHVVAKNVVPKVEHAGSDLTSSLSVGWIALISGLIGALITAVLNYIVRLRILKKDQSKKETQLVYTYLVQITQLIAIETALRKISQELLNKFPDYLKVFKDLDESEFEMSHRLCVNIADAIQIIPKEELNKLQLQKYLFVLNFFRNWKEDIEKFNIPNEILANFPKGAIRHYSHFVSQSVTINHIIMFWAPFFEKGERTWITADLIHGQWKSLRFFIEATHELRSALIKYSKIDSKDMDELLKYHEQNLTGEYFLQFSLIKLRLKQQKIN